MTMQPSPGAAAPEKASALVVGIESYGFREQPGSALRGAAKLAARFAEWLLDRGVCPADRIALMTAYHEADYAAAASPAPMLDYLAARGVRLLTDATADHGFTSWLAGNAPRADDARFVLFWAGHGHADSGDPDEHVRLLSADADDQKVRNIELKHLLHTVATYAPDAAQLAFVDACRGVIPAVWERKLAVGAQALPGGSFGPRTGRKQSILYAAAHGETTRTAGWTEGGENFGDVLLGELDELKPGSGPDALFEDLDALDRFVRGLSEGRQAAPFWTAYGYRHGSREHRPYPPPSDVDLTPDEWDGLLTVAETIDDRTHPGPSGPVLWSAFCHARGPGTYGLPDRLTSVGDLMVALRDLPPRNAALPPPLVVACDYVASLPAARAQPRLRKWCDQWAGGRSGAHDLLRLARERRPRRLYPCYLSIMINAIDEVVPQQPKGPRKGVPKYEVSGILWTEAGRPTSFPPTCKVPERDILGEAERILRQVGESREVPHLREMVVEFVLPRRLLWWRPEYEGSARFGLKYPVVVRDLERLLPSRADVGQLAEDKFHHISSSVGRVPPLSSKIEWFECASWPENMDLIVRAVGDPRTFCVVLAPPDGLAQANGNGTGRARSREAHPGLEEALDAGAAIVVWIRRQEAYYCRVNHGNALFRKITENGSRRCMQPIVKKLIRKGVDKGRPPQGLLDMPRLLRDIRSDIVQRDGSYAPPQIGVVMEDPTRFWPGYFGLQLASGPGQ